MMHGRDREQPHDHMARKEPQQAEMLRTVPTADQQPSTDSGQLHAQPPNPPLLRLQQHAGNRAVQRLVQRAQQAAASSEVTPEVAAAIEQARGGGQALDATVRAQFEPRFGTTFGQVRVHTDARADTLSRAVQARAFTTGSDLFFRQGAYQPGSHQGRTLLAHELTHVVQQQGASAAAPRTLSQPGDRSEQEAEHVAQAVMQHDQASPTAVLSPAAPSVARMAQTAVQRQIEEAADEQVALLEDEMEGPEQWIRAADWKPVDPEGTIVAGRLYSGDELAAIARCNTLQEVSAQVPGIVLPPGTLNKPFVKQKSPKGGGAIFKADFQQERIFEQLSFQGNGLLRYEIFSYDQVEVTPKRRKRQPAPTPQKVLKPRPFPEQQTFFEKSGRTINLPPIVKGKGKKRTETRAELTVKRKNLVGKFTQEAQARTVAELSSDQSEVVTGTSVAEVWEQSSPNDFFQSLTFRYGAAKQLKPAYQEVVRAFRAREFTPLGTLSKEEQRRFNDVQVWISGLIGKVDGWARAGKHAKAENLLALEAVPAMCNVISYYLYGQLIGKIPREKTFGQHVVEETRKGHIGSQIKESDDPNDKTADDVKDIVEVGGGFYGFGSGEWRKTFGAEVMKGDVPLTHESRRKEFETFLNSDVRIAISHQDVKGNGKPGHFHLIVKDQHGVWRNVDHTSERFERRGGATNFSKVYAVVFDKQALEAARAMLEQLEQQGTPVQVPPK